MATHCENALEASLTNEHDNRHRLLNALLAEALEPNQADLEKAA
jgi:hypothetical protein